MFTKEQRNAIEWLNEAYQFKRLAENNFGAQCEVFVETCNTCQAHRLANLNLQTATNNFNDYFAAK